MRTPRGASPQRRILARTGIGLWLLDAWGDLEQPMVLTQLPLPEEAGMGIEIGDAEEEPPAPKPLQAHSGVIGAAVPHPNALHEAQSKDELDRLSAERGWEAIRDQSGGYQQTMQPALHHHFIGATTIGVIANQSVFFRNDTMLLLREGLLTPAEAQVPTAAVALFDLSNENPDTEGLGGNEEATGVPPTMAVNDSESALPMPAMIATTDLAPALLGGGLETCPALLPELQLTTLEVPFPRLRNAACALPKPIGDAEAPVADFGSWPDGNIAPDEACPVGNRLAYGGTQHGGLYTGCEPETRKDCSEPTKEHLRDIVEQVLLDIFGSIEPV